MDLVSGNWTLRNRAWNTATKMIWDLPHGTHTRFLESFSPVHHLQSVLARRYIGFIQNLKTSGKQALSLLFDSCMQKWSCLIDWEQLEVPDGEAQQAVPGGPDQVEAVPEEAEGTQFASWWSLEDCHYWGNCSHKERSPWSWIWWQLFGRNIRGSLHRLVGSGGIYFINKTAPPPTDNDATIQ